ncbi:unnamed protein product [Staurois parvus]|uniref:Uncharacterized protein n=1 Tax=Staurois parvus TaxID=386267 RepID=A0ABN9BG40_9NEOB|nr:unnamed protein product [Staurois parvus]
MPVISISLLTSCHADSSGDMYTDDQCALMISVAPDVPPVHQCQLLVLINATCQCPSVPHQCHISVPI